MPSLIVLQTSNIESTFAGVLLGIQTLSLVDQRFDTQPGHCLYPIVYISSVVLMVAYNIIL